MRRVLRDYLAAQELDAAVLCDVVLAADDAFINSVGNAEAVDDPICCAACVPMDEAAVEIQDAGGGFTLSGSEAPPVPDVRRVSDRGVFPMKSLMDEVGVPSGRRRTTGRTGGSVAVGRRAPGTSTRSSGRGDSSDRPALVASTSSPRSSR
jgi:hypothetical protein